MSGGTSTSYSIGNIQGLVRPLRRRCTFCPSLLRILESHFSSPTGGPLKAALVKYVLGYLFPDSEANSQHFYSDSAFQNLPDPMMKWVAKYTGSGEYRLLIG